VLTVRGRSSSVYNCASAARFPFPPLPGRGRRDRQAIVSSTTRMLETVAGTVAGAAPAASHVEEGASARGEGVERFVVVGDFLLIFVVAAALLVPLFSCRGSWRACSPGAAAPPAHTSRQKYDKHDIEP
jgi:hypothetical protein